MKPKFQFTTVTSARWTTTAFGILWMSDRIRLNVTDHDRGILSRYFCVTIGLVYWRINLQFYYPLNENQEVRDAIARDIAKNKNEKDNQTGNKPKNIAQLPKHPRR